MHVLIAEMKKAETQGFCETVGDTDYTETRTIQRHGPITRNTEALGNSNTDSHGHQLRHMDMDTDTHTHARTQGGGEEGGMERERASERESTRRRRR